MTEYEYGLMWRPKNSNDEWSPVTENNFHRAKGRPRVYPYRHTAQGYLTALRANSYYAKDTSKNEYKLVKRLISPWMDDE